jgi:hypothetical protein
MKDSSNPVQRNATASSLLATAASLPRARCCFHDRLPEWLAQLPLPFGTFVSLRIKAFDWPGHPAARLPIPPDLRSLPAAFKLVN